jgi:hypothetical protein
VLGGIVAATAVLGPLVTGVLRYRTSATTLHQIEGGDVAALAVVAPWCLVAGYFAWRGRRAAPVLALPPSIFVLYTYTQLVVGAEYLRLPGNNERFFPVFYSGFVLAAAIAVCAWRRCAGAALPEVTVGMRRLVTGVLLAVAIVLLLQHAPTFADAMRAHPTRTEYLSSPTPFWLVKLMDLGVVLPAALVTARGTWRRAGWARVPAYAIVGAYALLGASVAGMGVTMYVTGDPDASLPMAAGFCVFALLFGALTARLYRPIVRR